MSLTRDQILSANDRKVIAVDIPEWGGQVYVRSLNAREALKHDAELKALSEQQAETEAVLAAQLATYLCDENGSLMFTKEQASGLLDRNPVALKRIVKAGMVANGFEDPEQIKEKS